MRRRDFFAGLGSAAAWPIVARAQQSAVPVIGFLDIYGPRPKAPFIEAFRKGLADSGFVEGANLFIEYRWAGGNFGRLPDLADDLVGHQVALIVAVAALGPAHRAQAATSTIPIVFLYGGDAVKDGLVASLNRPGGNVTGIMGIIGGERGGWRKATRTLVAAGATSEEDWIPFWR